MLNGKIVLKEALFERNNEDIIKYTRIAGSVASSGGGDFLGGSFEGGTKAVVECDGKVMWSTKDLNFIAKTKNGVYAYGYEGLTSQRSSAKVYSGSIFAELLKDGFDIRELEIIYVEDVQKRV